MVEEEKEMALNPGEGDTVDTTPVPEAAPTEGVIPEGAEVEPEAAEGEAEPDKVPSKKGENQRVRQLVKERNTEREKSQSLTEKLEKLTGTTEAQPMAEYQPEVAQKPIVSPGEEIDANELERRIQAREANTLRKADALAILRNKQSTAINRINKEASDSMTSYPELDPESDSFDEELSESVTEATAAYVKSDPYNASVKDFVGRMMRPYKRAVTREVGEATENLAKQVSEAALRPTATKPKEKSVDEKTMDELEEELGVVY